MERPRVIGTEMEWAIMLLRGENVLPVPETGVNTILKRLDQQGYTVPNRSGYMGTNGTGRWYQDVGSHVESSTAEDTSVLSVAASEAVAGDMLYKAVLSAQEQDNLCDDFAIYKSVCDETGNSWGYHVSILADAHRITDIEPENLGLLGLHLATCGIYAGGGMWLPNGEFKLSQKATALEADYSMLTTYNKPLVNLRDEPLADKKRYKRIHVTSLDPHISPWATAMTLGTTSLVVAMAERGITIPRIELQPGWLHRAAHVVADDVSMLRHVAMSNSRTIRPIDVQEALCNAAGKLDLDPEGEWIHSEWSKALATLQQNPFGLGRKSSWTTRYVHGKRNLEKGMSMQEVLHADRNLCRIPSPEAHAKLRAFFTKESGVDIEPLVKERSVSPPRATRAWTRAQLIANAPKDTCVTAEWEYVDINGETIPLPDPYAAPDIAPTQ